MMKPQRFDILVPVNFGLESLVAIDNAAGLAKFLNAKVVLLYVIPAADFISGLLQTREQIAAIETEALKRLNDLASELTKKEGIAIQTLVRQGKIHEIINSVADELNVRYILLGKKVSMPGETQRLGSIITQVVRQAKVPVMILKGERNVKVNYESICVPLDLTNQSKIQLFNALSFGIHYKAKIHLVSVLMGGIKVNKSRIYRKMKRAERMIRENGVDCSFEIYTKIDKPVHQVIVEHSRKVNAGLIILMTHRETQAYDNYIGAVASNIMNDSDVPVISLTSAAAQLDEKEMVKPFVDPFGFLQPGKAF